MRCYRSMMVCFGYRFDRDGLSKSNIVMDELEKNEVERGFFRRRLVVDERNNLTCIICFG